MYEPQEFPKWKYHPELPARIVNDVEQEAALGDGWFDAPPAVKPAEAATETAPEVEAVEEPKPAKQPKAPKQPKQAKS